MADWQQFLKDNQTRFLAELFDYLVTPDSIHGYGRLRVQSRGVTQISI